MAQMVEHLLSKHKVQYHQKKKKKKLKYFNGCDFILMCIRKVWLAHDSGDLDELQFRKGLYLSKG
jgi:hypothetical protein